MPKLKLTATKLENAEVSYLSLVNRGANRAPFKIIKTQEKGPMIHLNLAKAFKSDAKKPVEATIVGYVLQKSDDTKEMREVLAKSGVSMDAVQEFEDGTVLFKSDTTVEIKEDDTSIVPIKMNDSLVVLCKGFDPYRASEGVKSIAEIVKTQGFMPGFSMATEALYQVVRTSLRDATDKAEAIKSLEGAMGEYTSYMLGLAKEIPQSAFTVADAVNTAKEEVEKAAKVCKSCGAPCDEEGKYASPSTEKKEEAAPAAMASEEKKPDETTAAEAAAEGEVKKEDTPKGLTADDVTGIVAKSLEGVVASIGKNMADAIQKSQESTTEALKALTAKVDSVAKDATDAKDLAVKNDKALKGTITADPQESDPNNPKAVKKEEGGMGCIDTAYHRNVRKEVRFSDVNARTSARL